MGPEKEGALGPTHGTSVRADAFGFDQVADNELILAKNDKLAATTVESAGRVNLGHISGGQQFSTDPTPAHSPSLPQPRHVPYWVFSAFCYRK